MTDLYVPLQFWYYRNTALSLPSVSIGYHECPIDLTNNNIHLFNPDCHCHECDNTYLVIEI